MHVLITNDDGIFAPGIQALANACIELGFRVSICAPSQQRSAAGHGIALHSVMVHEIEWPGARAISIDGSPADCVRVGLQWFAQDADVVISGVNDGYNLGTDVYYSGTVAAAREGAISGKRAIAVSVHTCKDEHSLAAAAQLACRAALSLKKDPLPAGNLLNINYPSDCAISDIISAPMAHVRYGSEYETENGGEDGIRFHFKGRMDSDFSQVGTDSYYAHKGYVTLTSIGLDSTKSDDLTDICKLEAFELAKTQDE